MFDAGSIEAKATLDRTALTEGLRQAKAEAERWARDPIKLKVTADLTAANERVAAFRQRVERMNLRAKVRVDIDTNNAEQRLDRMTRQLGNDLPNASRRSEQGLGRLNQRMGESERAAKRANDQFSLMRFTIETLGPAVVPLAAGLGGLATAAVGFGIAGVSAFQDVKAQIKDGTALGGQWNAVLMQGKQTLSTFISGSSVNLLSGFNRGLASIQGRLPALNGLLNTSGLILGNVVAHGISGIVGGLTVATPLIEQGERYVAKLAAGFDSWANGSGGAKFVGFLSQEFKLIVPLLQNLAVLAVHFMQGLTPPGNTAIQFLTTFSGLLDHIPVGVLQAATTAYIAFRTAVAVTSGIKAATTALEGFAAAETAAAAASTAAAGTAGAAGAAGLGSAALARLRAAGGSAEAAAAAAAAQSGLAASTRAYAGSMATIISRSIPYIAAYVGITYAVSTLAGHFDDLNTTLDVTHARLGGAANYAKDLLTLHWGDAFGPNALFAGQAAQQRLDTRNTAQTQINVSGSNLGTAQYAAGGGGLAGITGNGFSPGAFQAIVRNNGSMARLTKDIQHSYEQLGDAERGLDKAQKAYTRNASEDNYAAVADAKKLVDQWRARYYNAQLGANALQRIARVTAQQRRITNQTAASYVDPIRQRNAAQLGVGINNAQTLQQGTDFLTSYTQNLNKAVAGERQWTKVTDDNTVRIGKNQYEMRAWVAAMAQSGQNVARAKGLLIGHTEALAADSAALAKAQREQNRLNAYYGETSTRLHLTTAQIDLYRAAAGITIQQVARGVLTQAQFNRAIAATARAVSQGNSAMTTWIGAIQQFQSGIDTAASRGQLLGAAMVALNGDTIAFQNTLAQGAAANQQFVTDFRNLHKGVFDATTGMLNFHNAGAAPVLADLQSLQTAAQNAAAAEYQHKVGLEGSKQAAADAAKVYRDDTTNALVAEAKQLGLTHDQAEKLAQRYFHWPKNAKTLISQLGGNQVNTLLGGILRQLKILNGFKVAPVFNRNGLTQAQTAADRLLATLGQINGGQGAVSIPGRMIPTRAVGGGVPEGYSIVGDGGSGPGARPEMLYKRGAQVDVIPTHKMMAMLPHLAAAGYQIPAFAGGTGGDGGFTGVTGGSGSGHGSSSGSSGGGTHHKHTWLDDVIDVFHNAGYNNRAIGGILGNAKEESGLQPFRRQGTASGTSNPLIVDGNTGWGLWQWTSRNYQQALMSRFGQYPSAVQQAQYLVGLIGGLKGSLNGAPDAATAAARFMNGFEHPNMKYANLPYRESAANSIYATLAAGGSLGTSAAGGSTGPTAAQQAQQKYRQNHIYSVNGLQYQGLAARNQQMALVQSRGNTSNIVQVGHGAYAGYGFNGQGFGSSYEAHNAMVQYGRQRGRALNRADNLLGKVDRNSAAGRILPILQNLEKVITTGKDAKNLRADFHTLSTDLRRRDRTMQILANDRAKLRGAEQARNATRRNIASNFLGQFDVTSSGQGYAYGIQYDLEQATANTEKYGRLIARAKKMHLNGALVMQFLNQPGGMANLEAILNAGQGYIDTLDSDYDKLRQVSNEMGYLGTATNGQDRKVTALMHTVAVAEHHHQEAINAVRTELITVRKLVHSIQREGARKTENHRKKTTTKKG